MQSKKIFSKNDPQQKIPMSTFHVIVNVAARVVNTYYSPITSLTLTPRRLERFFSAPIAKTKMLFIPSRASSAICNT